jgi:hypothetical protein
MMDASCRPFSCYCLLHHQRTRIHSQARIRSELVSSYGLRIRSQWRGVNSVSGFRHQSLRTRGDKQYARQAPHAGWGNRIDFLPPLRWGNCNNSRSYCCQWDKEVSQPETVGMHLPASNDALRSQPRPVHPPDPIAGRGHMIPAHETGIKTAASFYPRKITAGLVKSFVPCPSWTRETRGRHLPASFAFLMMCQPRNLSLRPPVQLRLVRRHGNRPSVALNVCL